MIDNGFQKATKFPVEISFVDKGILRVLEEFECATINQIMALLPQGLKRSLNIIRSRCRALENKYGYIKALKNGLIKVYLMTPAGYQQYTGKPLSSQEKEEKAGYKYLVKNYVRAEWASQQEGVVSASGCDRILIKDDKPASMIIDAIAQNSECARYLIVDYDDPAESIREITSRIEEFYVNFESHVPLDIIVFFGARRQKIEAFVQGKDMNVVVLYRPL